MWLTLKKLGVPDSTIDIIRSFQDGMTAQIKLNGTLLAPISVDNGLRQGCCMASVPFKSIRVFRNETLEYESAGS